MHNTNTVFKELNGFPYKMHVSTKGNSCRIAIQWFHASRYSGIPYTKIQPYISRVHFLCFCMIRNLGSPTIYMHTIDTNAKHAISYMKQLDLAPLSSLARTEASCGRVHLTALGGIRELCTSHVYHRRPWGRGIAGLLIFQFPKPC